MEIYKILLIGLLTCVMVLIVRQTKPEIAVIIGIVGGLVILFMCIESLSKIVSTMEDVVAKTGLSQNIFKTVIKIVGVGYLAEFASNICADAGVSVLADKLILAGKILILVIALPIITNIIDIIVELVP